MDHQLDKKEKQVAAASRDFMIDVIYLFLIGCLLGVIGGLAK